MNLGLEDKKNYLHVVIKDEQKNVVEDISICNINFFNYF